MPCERLGSNRMDGVGDGTDSVRPRPVSRMGLEGPESPESELLVTEVGPREFISHVSPLGTSPL